MELMELDAIWWSVEGMLLEGWWGWWVLVENFFFFLNQNKG
jgi:hypothetical protein